MQDTPDFATNGNLLNPFETVVSPLVDVILHGNEHKTPVVTLFKDCINETCVEVQPLQLQKLSDVQGTINNVERW